MNTNRIVSLFGLFSGFSLALTLGVLAPNTAVAHGGWGGGNSVCKAPTPDEFSKVMMFMANGQTGLDGGEVFDFDEFQFEVMGRSQAEVDQNLQDAKDFYLQRFGLDVDNDPGLFLQPFALSRDARYRAYMISDDRVPSAGWEVRDGGYALVVVDPAGRTLGGEFAGQFAPAGSVAAFGDYNILKVNHGGQAFGEIVMSYRSQVMIQPEADGTVTFACLLSSDEYGEGLAQGSARTVVDGDGVLTYNYRNVLTFSDLDGL